MAFFKAVIFLILVVVISSSQEEIKEDHQASLESTDSPQTCCLETQREMAKLQKNVLNILNEMSQIRDALHVHTNHTHPHKGHVFEPDTRDHRHRHHHGHHSRRRGVPPSAFKRPPTFRNPEDFDVAACLMKPNPTIKDNQVQGIVYLSQKKNSETVYINVMMSGFNVSSHLSGAPSTDSDKEATEKQTHGFHVHEIANLSDGCDTAGSHYNPFNKTHGGPNSLIRHIGDFGNVASDGEGAINILLTDEVASLRGPHTIIGRPLVVHAVTDDLGSDLDDPGSQTTGNSGVRLACCIIEELPVTRDHDRHQQVVSDSHRHVDRDSPRHGDRDQHQNADRDSHHHIDRDSRQHGDRDEHQHVGHDDHQHEDRDSHQNVDHDSRRHGDRDKHQNKNGDSHRHGDRDSRRHGDRDSRRYGDRDSRRYGDRDSRRNADTDSSQLGDRDSRRHGDRDSHHHHKLEDETRPE